MVPEYTNHEWIFKYSVTKTSWFWQAWQSRRSRRQRNLWTRSRPAEFTDRSDGGYRRRRSKRPQDIRHTLLLLKRSRLAQSTEKVYGPQHLPLRSGSNSPSTLLLRLLTTQQASSFPRSLSRSPIPVSLGNQFRPDAKLASLHGFFCICCI